MNRVNSSWVFTDSIKGHEVQSLALAESIAKKSYSFQCQIKQPWLLFSPKIFPLFKHGLNWQGKAPNIQEPPDCVISCGRRMAAVAKYYSAKLSVPHIQILNPGDSLSRYSVVVLPKHDNLRAENVISTLGSLHDYSQEKLKNLKLEQKESGSKKRVAIIIGNQDSEEVKKQLIKLNSKGSFENKLVYLVLSRRSNIQQWNSIEKELEFITQRWFDESDGQNPYQWLLAHSDAFIVTNDSINMTTEVCATDKPVLVLKGTKSKKHENFFQSLGARISRNELALNKRFEPIYELDRVAELTLKMLAKL